MREVMTKNMARNIFYGGSLFFILIFVGLSVQSHYYIVTTSTEVVAGTATPFRNSIRIAAELTERKDDEIGNNAVIELTYRGKYDATLGYALKASVTCETASL